MLDTLTIADRLTDAGVEQKQANAIAHAIHDAQGEIVTKADLQQVRADLQHFATKADLYRVILLQTTVILATIFAILRFLD